MNPTDSQATSPTLLAAARTGNAVAWERVVACYQPTILRWCRYKGLDEATSLDVVQETFLSVSKSLSKFHSTPGSGAFRAWLWRITQCRIMDYRRKQASQPHAIGGSSIAKKFALLTDPCNEGESTITQAHPSATAAMKRLADSYEPRTWNAFLRMFIDGRSTAEVASEFNMTAVAVRQLRSRILRRLQRDLEENLPDRLA